MLTLNKIKTFLQHFQPCLLIKAYLFSQWNIQVMRNSLWLNTLDNVHQRIRASDGSINDSTATNYELGRTEAAQSRRFPVNHTKYIAKPSWTTILARPLLAPANRGSIKNVFAWLCRKLPTFRHLRKHQLHKWIGCIAIQQRFANERSVGLNDFHYFIDIFDNWQRPSTTFSQHYRTGIDEIKFSTAWHNVSSLLKYGEAFSFLVSSSDACSNNTVSSNPMVVCDLCLSDTWAHRTHTTRYSLLRPTI